MMKKQIYHSRIFLGLLIISLLLSYLALTLTAQFASKLAFDYGTTPLHPNIKVEVGQTLSTDSWKTYTDPAFPITLKYPEDWKLTTKQVNGFYNIAFDIPKVKEKMNIYINPKGYYGLAGLPMQLYNINDYYGTFINDLLIGLKSGDYYYTFDGSFTPSQQAEFKTILRYAKLK